MTPHESRLHLQELMGLKHTNPTIYNRYVTDPIVTPVLLAIPLNYSFTSH